MNDSTGLNKNNNNDQLQQRINQAQVDYDFYTNGIPFIGAMHYSANHLFGNGKWKNTVKELVGEQVFNNYATFYGTRPTDFYLLAFKTEYPQYFKPGHKIQVKDNNGTYNGVATVVCLNNKTVLMSAPFIKGTENNTGTLINVTRAEGAKKALDRFAQMQTDSSSTPEAAPKEKIAAEVITQNETVKPNEQNKAIKTIGWILLGLLIVYVGYNFFSKKAAAN